MTPPRTSVKQGIRVQLRDHPFGVRLRSFGGRIARPAEDDGYFIVELDEPAQYYHADGSTEPITEIREAGDNLVVVPADA